MIINRKARLNYQIYEEVEAGVALTGGEVKSLREGRGKLEDSFVRVKDDGAWLVNMNIPVYQFADPRQYQPTRERRLLLKKRELLALEQKVKGRGWVLVPLRCKTKGRFIKIIVGLGRGRKQFEKKAVVKQRSRERELRKELKEMGLE